MQDDCITIALRLPEVQVVWEEETATEITVEIRHRAEGCSLPALRAVDTEGPHQFVTQWQHQRKEAMCH